MKNLQNQNIEQKNGFRVAWFIPIEMLISGTVLGLAPMFGLGLSFALVGIPSLILLIKLSKLQNRLSEPYIEEQKHKLAILTPQETLAYLNSDTYDFTKPSWYEERVLKEIATMLNPFTRLKKIIAMITKRYINPFDNRQVEPS